MTFIVTAGDLAIAAPTNVPLSSVVLGTDTVASGQIGTVTITDARGDNLATWSATVATTEFVNGASTIPANQVNYNSNEVTVPAGEITPNTPIDDNFASAGTPLDLFSFAGAGGNTASWNPELTVSVPATAVAGTYTATVTHSVT